jgi:predicted enzyme related to lactoylglutathione lyase
VGVVLILDCNDLDREAEFWAAALRYREVYRDEPYLVLMPEEHEGSGLVLQLQRVPEPKTGKNRLHLDLHVAAIEPEVDRLVRLGARPLNEPNQESGYRWRVMADPEGNEFCVCARCG